MKCVVSSAALLSADLSRCPAEATLISTIDLPTLPPVASFEAIAKAAFVYGFPSFEIARLRYRATMDPRGPRRALNTLTFASRLTDPTTQHVTASNSDTLFGSAWIDLSNCALTLSVPDMGQRYYSVALIDAYSNNVAIVGSRTTGNAAAKFIIANRSHSGPPPNNAHVIQVPGADIWLLVRILVSGTNDVTEARRLQSKFQLRWLAGDGIGGHLSGPASHGAVVPTTATALSFLAVLNQVLARNPPPQADRDILAKLAGIGVGPKRTFRPADFSPTEITAIRDGLRASHDSLIEHVRDRMWIGWNQVRPHIGDFGTRYLTRARVALAGLGALPRDEAMYFSARTDANGIALTGSSRFVLHFAADELPPVKAFWSVTAYTVDASGRRWLAANSSGRYSIGSHTPGLLYAADGSLDVFIQSHDPGPPRTGNWLPTPSGPFTLSLRAYWPEPPLLDGRYRPPAPIQA